MLISNTLLDIEMHLADITAYENLAGMIAQLNPKVILCSIEDINDPQIQKQLQELTVAYVAIDEAQVRYLITSLAIKFKYP